MLTFAGKNSLTFFGECVADSGPEEVVRRICNNSGIDEGMISKLRILIFPEGAVGIVDDTDGSHGRAVAGNSREGK